MRTYLDPHEAAIAGHEDPGHVQTYDPGRFLWGTLRYAIPISIGLWIGLGIIGWQVVR